MCDRFVAAVSLGLPVLRLYFSWFFHVCCRLSLCRIVLCCICVVRLVERSSSLFPPAFEAILRCLVLVVLVLCGFFAPSELITLNRGAPRQFIPTGPQDVALPPVGGVSVE